jgi:hypothetical protein
LKNKIIEFKPNETKEEVKALANKLNVIRELVDDGIISEKLGLEIRRKLTTKNK